MKQPHCREKPITVQHIWVKDGVAPASHVTEFITIPWHETPSPWWWTKWRQGQWHYEMKWHLIKYSINVCVLFRTSLKFCTAWRCHGTFRQETSNQISISFLEHMGFGLGIPFSHIDTEDGLTRHSNIRHSTQFGLFSGQITNPMRLILTINFLKFTNLVRYCLRFNIIWANYIFFLSYLAQYTFRSKAVDIL